MREAHGQRFLFKVCKAGGSHIAQHGQVMSTGLQILPKGQHGDAVITQILHDLQNLVVGFAQAQHQAGFGRHLWMTLAKGLEQRQ